MVNKFCCLVTWDIPCWPHMILPLDWHQAVVRGYAWKDELFLAASALPAWWTWCSRWVLQGKATVLCPFECVFPVNGEMSFPVFLFWAQRTQLYLHIFHWCHTIHLPNRGWAQSHRLKRGDAVNSALGVFQCSQLNRKADKRKTSHPKIYPATYSCLPTRWTYPGHRSRCPWLLRSRCHQGWQLQPAHVEAPGCLPVPRLLSAALGTRAAQPLGARHPSPQATPLMYQMKLQDQLR